MNVKETAKSLRRKIREARRARVDDAAVADMKKKIHRWGWWPAVRWAAKNGVPIEVCVAAHAKSDSLDFTKSAT